MNIIDFGKGGYEYRRGWPHQRWHIELFGRWHRRITLPMRRTEQTQNVSRSYEPKNFLWWLLRRPKVPVQR